MCLRGLIVVLFCRIHGLDVPMSVWSSQDAIGPQKIQPAPPPPPFPVVCDRKKKMFFQQTECIGIIWKVV